MSAAVIQALRVAMAKKQKRADLLDRLMHEKHIRREDCILHDDLARKFNAATGEERYRIFMELGPVLDRISEQSKKAMRQNENYMNWSAARSELLREIHDLANEIALKEFHQSIREGR